jgi:hypothetical protein
MNANAVAGDDADRFQIRRMSHDDAAGVVDCLRQVYGGSYVHPELYDPAEILRRNEARQLVSVVAIDGNNRVVGHYALERALDGVIAEAGVAIVLPEVRHHRLMERMRELLEQEAMRLNLIGLFGHAVTNHTFTQHVDERFHEEPCAISLGWSPRTFHNMPEPLPQRMSELLYFKYLQKPGVGKVHLPAHHAEWCIRIYAELQLAVEALPGTASSIAGAMDMEVRRELGRAVFRVRTVGAESATQLASATDEQMRLGCEVCFVELPLAQAGTPDLCEAMETAGYFFSGLGPSFASDGDVLRLQKLNVPLNPNLIQLESAHSRELLAYVLKEQARTARGTPQ